MGRDLLFSELSDGTSDHCFGFGRTNVHGRLRLYHMDPEEPVHGNRLTLDGRQLTMAIVAGCRATLVVVSLLLVIGIARPAAADVTIFGGTTQSGGNRPVVGGALGLGIALFGLEFEYANTQGDDTNGIPSLQTGMFNVLLRTPEISRFRAYGTIGGGMYREQLRETGDTGFGTSGGGGLSIGLMGPVRVRLDYRRFRLGRRSAGRTPHRVYAGISLTF